MSAKIFYEKDASLAPLEGKNIVFVGYGNQGRAQCLNLQDTVTRSQLKTPPQILIANPNDKYAATASLDGVNYTGDFAHAASIADVLFLLIPDQFQPSVFNDQLAPHLKPTCCIVVASGYNVFYKKLAIASTNDVVMVAPRMIGTSVRSLFVKGAGFPCFISTEQDGTGHAEELCLALSLGIGALQQGGIKSSCREETMIDLFAEQALFPTIITLFQEAYSTLKSLGASDEALCYELFMSKEAAEIFEKMADDGFVRQLVHHSTVSQYGQLKGALEMTPEIVEPLKKEFRRVAENRVLNGAFAKDFTALEQGKGGVQAELDRLYTEANKSELAQGEIKVRNRLGMQML